MPLKENERPLSEIAKEIRKTWEKLSPYAKPYVDAMAEMSSPDENYYLDSGRSIVAYFLSNAGYWRGEDARRIKKELNKMLEVRNE